MLTLLSLFIPGDELFADMDVGVERGVLKFRGGVAGGIGMVKLTLSSSSLPFPSIIAIGGWDCTTLAPPQIYYIIESVVKF